MPIPKPQKGEERQEYISKVIKMLMHEGGRSQLQCIAIAHESWRNRNKKKKKK